MNTADVLQRESAVEAILIGPRSDLGVRNQTSESKNVPPRGLQRNNSLQMQARTDERAVFETARNLINPGRFFRYVTHLYAERKLLVLFWCHLVATMVIWGHFALIKFEEKKASVPETAPYYWWKRIVPPLEFGSMHAILFQMALIPLTMSRFSIASLSSTPLSKFIPFNRMLQIHIHLGYVMVGVVFVATIVFFAFFGMLCRNGEQAFCDKFESEIMITGYCILAFLLIVAGTSYFRYRIPYEVFYVVHHYVFLMYIVTTLHTFDVVQRTGERDRSQTFKWYSASILFYICDRACMHINNRYRVRVLSSSVVSGGRDSKMIILKLKRPALMCFYPGQYAFLKIPEIDTHWHPYSIASGPQSEFLEFYIEVFDEGSWTRNLWEMLDGNGDRGNTRRKMWVEVMGPYGTPIANVQDFSHVISIGSGTGVVPMLSMLKQHVRFLLRLEPSEYFRNLRQLERDVHRLEVARQPRKGSLFQKLVDCWKEDAPAPELVAETLRHQVKRRLRRSIRHLNTQSQGSYEHLVTTREIKDATSKVTRLYYGVVALVAMPVLGVTLLAMQLSWCTLPFDKAEWMVSCLAVSTTIFYGLFGVVATCFWDGNGLPAYIDSTFSIVGAFSCWYWYKKDLFGSFSTFDMLSYLTLTGYMTARCWYEVVKPRHHSFRKEMLRSGINTVDKMEFVWVTRSAKLVNEIMPDINRIYDTLVNRWGEEHTQRVLQIRVCVTDKDAGAVQRLTQRMKGTNLYQKGNYSFERPNLTELVEDHTLDCSTKLRNSYTLLAFCGSPQLSNEIHRIKISNDISAAITGNRNHQMEFVSESYGGYKSRSGKKETTEDAPDDGSSVFTTGTVNPWRRTRSYDLTGTNEDWEDEEATSPSAESDIDSRMFEI